MRALLVGWSILIAVAGEAQLPDYLRDRGTGIPTSMFGTYVRRGELLIYPFFEYYRDADYEYAPEELGFGLDEDFRGEYRAKEFLLFLGYGVTDRLAVELEAAFIDATFRKAPDDPTGVPAEIDESGLGDVEGQVRYRFLEETAEGPEIFGFFETVFPLQKDKLIIGTSDWEYKLGAGAIKGFRFGTMTFRAAVEYSGEKGSAEAGEYAIEYLRRLSPRWRVYAGIEGVQDEIELIAEAQLHLSPRVFVKFNNAVGLTSKATDWAPELGVVFSFGRTR